MNLRLSNQTTMVGACITVAQSPDYKNVWLGNPPADFATELTQLQTDYGAVMAKAALADGATGGAADAKAAAESNLEDTAYVLARALAYHFKKTGDLNRLGKVDVSKSQIVQLRNQALASKTMEIRDVGADTVGEPDAAGRGVTAARIAALTAAITSFSSVMSQPRGQIVNRSTLLKEVETDVAALVQKVSDMDDLVLQFDGTAAGQRFIEAWKRARAIVYSGGGSGPTPPNAAHPVRAAASVKIDGEESKPKRPSVAKAAVLLLPAP